jgi:hypothetical protein
MNAVNLAGRLTYAVAGQVDWLVRPFSLHGLELTLLWGTALPRHCSQNFAPDGMLCATLRACSHGERGLMRLEGQRPRAGLTGL